MQRIFIAPCYESSSGKVRTESCVIGTSVLAIKFDIGSHKMMQWIIADS